MTQTLTSLGPDTLFFVLVEFMLLSSLMGGIMRTLFATALAWRLLRLSVFPLGLFSFLRVFA